jgi:hypothetical protein
MDAKCTGDIAAFRGLEMAATLNRMRNFYADQKHS